MSRFVAGRPLVGVLLAMWLSLSSGCQPAKKMPVMHPVILPGAKFALMNCPPEIRIHNHGNRYGAQ